MPKAAVDFNARQSKCRVCQNEYSRAWYRANRERMIALATAWQRANRAKKRAYGRRYAERNPEKTSRWSRQNPDKRRVVAREWARRNIEKVEDHTRNRRARLRNAFVERVETAKVRERDAGICGICGGAVARKDESLGHITPLARGGEHSYANVQLAHLSCNKRKNDGRGADP